MNKNYEVIIIGAGAAGLMCAGKIAKSGKSTLLVEKSSKIAQKIRISGGGRCNFTNLYTSSENYTSQNHHFTKSALSRFTPDDFINMMNEFGLSYNEKKQHPKVRGQLFCDQLSTAIIEMLVNNIDINGGKIITDCTISEISKNNNFILNTNMGEFSCKSLVIATGGLAIPKIGASDFGYKIAKQFNLNIIPTGPALVPLTCDGNMLEICRNLSGVAIDAIVTCKTKSFRENILFTHQGISGPAILQISSFWKKGEELKINLIPDIDLITILQKNQKGQTILASILNKIFPKRFTQQWLEIFTHSTCLAECKKTELLEIVHELENFSIFPSGTQGYKKAEVTIGGIDTNEISSKTFEAKKIPNLYFIGEVLDVTGWLGGYNFQWAWASAHAMAENYK